MNENQLRAEIERVRSGKLSRRRFIEKMALLGLSTPMATALLAVSSIARAQGFFKQSPGPLTSSHAALEGQDNCLKCHTKGKDLANTKCLECHDHENMKRTIQSARGFHATEKVSGKNCWLCHAEHKGREHHNWAFSSWLAGAGVKRGVVHGATDEYGIRATEKPVHVHDFHATILHLMGLNHEKLTYRHAGRDYRLTDVSGQVVKAVLA